MHTHEESIEKLRKLLKEIRFGMLATTADDGSIHSRPMATHEIEPSGVLWFFTALDSGKVHELERDSHANVSYSKPEDELYVSVSGIARTLRDPAKVAELWNPMLKAWFPEGKDDPNIALIRFEVQKAEYWDSPSSKVVQLIGFAKAALTGKSYADEVTEHAKIEL